MNHVSRIREADSVAAAIRLYDGAGAVIGILSGPVALEFEQHLNPARHDGAGRLHTAKREIVALARETAARIADNEDLESARERRKHAESHAGFRQKRMAAGSAQDPPLRGASKAITWQSIR